MERQATDSGVGESGNTMRNSGTMPLEIDWDDDVTEINSEDREWLLEKGSPLSQSLLRIRDESPVHPTKLFKDKRTVEESHCPSKIEVAEKMTQTEMLFPVEDTRAAREVVKNVEILRSLFALRKFTSENEDCRVKSVDDAVNLSHRLATYTTYSENISRLTPNISPVKNPDPDFRRGSVNVPNVNSSATTYARINGCGEQENKRQKINPSSEALRYSLRQQSSDNPSAIAYRKVFDYMAQLCLKDLQYVTDRWVGSLMETATETLITTADIEGNISSAMLTRFCQRLINSIEKEDRINQVKLQESRVHFTLKLCESTVVSVGVVNDILLKLILLRDSLKSEEILSNLTNHIVLLENTPYLLYILKRVLKRLEEYSIKDLVTTTMQSNANILNLWRTHWKPAEKTLIEAVEKPSICIIWCDELNEILKDMTEHTPVFAPTIMECIDSVMKMKCEE